MAKHKAAALAPVAALGIVFGDIGTSPLYAVKELVFRSGADHSTTQVTGAISLVIWLLTIVICFKYVMVVLRADNEEQGGVFALLALLHQHRGRIVVLLSGLLVFAAGMLLGDGVITPAISVLSAVEGLSVASPEFVHYTVPITLAILTGLFAFQSHGTEKVGKLFGPIMFVWFVFLGVLGATSLVQEPKILEALNPVNAVEFLTSLSMVHLFLAIGSVILVVTGGEALFADLGHLGKRPIRQSWFLVVYPALLLNYLGQGAYLLSGKPVVNHNIFFSMVPDYLLYPSVLLAAVATVIASQALITGAFSLVAQGIALKYLPTLRVVHTHEEHEGQTYLPLVNWALYVGAIFLVVTFRSSSHLAAAYGLAVAADMMVTTLSVSAVARLHWRWPRIGVAAVFVPLGIIDSGLFLGNVSKIPSGGYVPLALGAVMVSIMTTWKWGREQVRAAFREQSTMSMRDLVEMRRNGEFQMLRKPTVLLTQQLPTDIDDPAPPLLELFYKRLDALPEHMIMLRISQIRVPYVDEAERYQINEFDTAEDGSHSMRSIIAYFGFRESPDVEDVISAVLHLRPLSPEDDLSVWMFHAGRERIIGRHEGTSFARARYGLFKVLSRQAEPAYSYFGMDDDARMTIEYLPVKI